MSQVPTLEITPDTVNPFPAYATVLARWEAEGRPETVENMAAGWLYRAAFPHGDRSTPHFLLVCSAQQTLTASQDGDTAILGYAAAMSTRQKSWRGRGQALPKEAIG